MSYGFGPDGCGYETITKEYPLERFNDAINTLFNDCNIQNWGEEDEEENGDDITIIAEDYGTAEWCLVLTNEEDEEIYSRNRFGKPSNFEKLISLVSSFYSGFGDLLGYYSESIFED